MSFQAFSDFPQPIFLHSIFSCLDNVQDRNFVEGLIGMRLQLDKFYALLKVLDPHLVRYLDNRKWSQNEFHQLVEKFLKWMPLLMNPSLSRFAWTHLALFYFVSRWRSLSTWESTKVECGKVTPAYARAILLRKWQQNLGGVALSCAMWWKMHDTVALGVLVFCAPATLSHFLMLLSSLSDQKPEPPWRAALLLFPLAAGALQTGVCAGGDNVPLGGQNKLKTFVNALVRYGCAFHTMSLSLSFCNR